MRPKLIIQPKRGEQVIGLVKGESIRFFQRCAKSRWILTEPVENYIDVVVVVELPLRQFFWSKNPRRVSIIKICDRAALCVQAGQRMKRIVALVDPQFELVDPAPDLTSVGL